MMLFGPAFRLRGDAFGYGLQPGPIDPRINKAPDTTHLIAKKFWRLNLSAAELRLLVSNYYQSQKITIFP